MAFGHLEGLLNLIQIGGYEVVNHLLGWSRTTHRFLGIFSESTTRISIKPTIFGDFVSNPALGAPHPPGSDQTRTSQRGRSQPCRWNASCRCEATKKKGGKTASLCVASFAAFGVSGSLGVTEVKAREVLVLGHSFISRPISAHVATTKR